MFLTPEEIAGLTQRKHRKSQIAVLNSLGITHKIRPDGSLVVAKAHALQVFGVKEDKKQAKEIEPNWGALQHA
jgi:hypothetical protein